MKNFFKSMYYAIKSFYAENRRIILFLLTGYGSITVTAGIATLLTDNDAIVLFFGIIGVVVGMMLLANYLHYQEAKRHSKEHNVSFETAWERTKPSDEDCI